MLFLSACHNDSDSITEIAPIALNVKINQPIQPGLQVTASYQYRDYGSAEGQSLYEWQLNNNLLATTLEFLLPSDSEGQTLMFCITPVPAADITKQGDKVCDSVTIEGEYTAPRAENVTISGEITTGVELSGSYDFIDEKGRAEGVSEFLWLLNAEPYAQTPMVVLANTEAEKLISFCITPKAQSGENMTGEQVCTPELLVASKEGSAPIVENLAWDIFAKPNAQLTLIYNYSDADGDLEGESIYQWYLDGAEVGQSKQYNVPEDSAGKILKTCITPIALTGVPQQGNEFCFTKDIAGIFVTGELKLFETLSLEIKGYTVLGITWVIKHPDWAPVRSTSETSFTIIGESPTEEAFYLVAVDLELCMTSEEEGEMCLLVAEFPNEQVTGGLPTELDNNNNVIKRVISPVDYIDLTLSGVTKRLHRPLTVIESQLLNLASNGSIPLHSDFELEVAKSLSWALYTWQDATDFCVARNMVLPVEGVSDITDAFGLQQYYDFLVSQYPQFPTAHVSRLLGWANSGTYHRTSSLFDANRHRDYYLLLGDPSWIGDEIAEFASCLETLP